MLRSLLPKCLRHFDSCSMAVVSQIADLGNCSTIHHLVLNIYFKYKK